MNERLIGDDGELINSDNEAVSEPYLEKPKKKRSEPRVLSQSWTFWVIAGGVVVIAFISSVTPQWPCLLPLLFWWSISLGAVFWPRNRAVSLGFIGGLLLSVIGLYALGSPFFANGR